MSSVVVVIIEECVLVVRPQWTCAFFLNFPHSAESQASATEAKLPPNVFPCEETGLHALCAWRSRYEKERACKYHHLACQAPVPKLVNQMSHASSLWWGQRKNGIVPSYISAENEDGYAPFSPFNGSQSCKTQGTSCLCFFPNRCNPGSLLCWTG